MSESMTDRLPHGSEYFKVYHDDLKAWTATLIIRFRGEKLTFTAQESGSFTVERELDRQWREWLKANNVVHR